LADQRQTTTDDRADEITEQLLQEILKESLVLPQRKATKLAPTAEDVFFVDQLSIEKEEKREWIEIR